MKKLSIALFAVLFLAVAFLYFLNLKGNNDKKTSDNLNQNVTTAEGIAYVNIDTIIYNFDMFFDRRAELILLVRSTITTRDTFLAGHVLGHMVGEQPEFGQLFLHPGRFLRRGRSRPVSLIELFKPHSHPPP